MTRSDYGSTTDPLNSPSHSAWAASVASDLDSAFDSIADSGWISLPLIAPWVNYLQGYGEAAYRRIGGVVHLGGLILGGAPSGSPMATLPVGFRPLYKLAIPILVDDNVAGHMYAQVDGTLQTASCAAGAINPLGWLLLDGISFVVQ